MSKSLGNTLSIDAHAASGCAASSCATTSSVRTTGRRSSTPTPRCRSRWPPTGASSRSCTGCASGSARRSRARCAAEFVAAMDDDLGTPGALAAIHSAVREGNIALDAGDRAARRPRRRLGPRHDRRARARPARPALGRGAPAPTTPRRRRARARWSTDLLAQRQEARGQPRLRRRRRGARPAHRRRGVRRGLPDGPTWSLKTSHRRTCSDYGRQLQAPRRDAQGRHQEGHGRRFRRPAPRALKGKGPTPPAEMRPGHPAARQGGVGGEGRRARPARRASVAANRRRPGDGETPETVLGRNPVVECLRAGVPATALHVAIGGTGDERVAEAVHLAADAGISILEVAARRPGPASPAARCTRASPCRCRRTPTPTPTSCWRSRPSRGQPGLIVALDGVTDPRNLGAVVRSVGAFGGHGVVVPQRRAAGMTAVAWRTSAGVAARLPVARATNLTRTLQEYATAGFMIAGLDAEGRCRSTSSSWPPDPLVLVDRVRGQGPAPAGQADLRRHRVDPDGRAGGVAQRLRRRRCRAGRGGAAAQAALI